MKVPKEGVARLHELATDLAIGYDEGAWGGSIKEYVFEWPLRIDENHPDERIARLVILRCEKWGDNFPEYYGMESLGYLERTTFGGSSVDIYMITEKALRLADAPAVPPNVFISYKRSESSAFALLLEARIKYETNATPFLDKSLEPGDDWHPKLEEKVKSCETFVCVIGPSTLESPYVRNEIQWAQSNGKNSLILPVWHNEYAGSHPNDTLKGKQAVIVGGENAKNYDSAVNEVLNRLGYSPQFIAQRQSG